MNRLLCIPIFLVLIVAETANAQTPAGKPDGAAVEPNKSDAGAIKGRVTGEGGQPIAGVVILVFPVNLTENPAGMMALFFSPVTTDSEGKFLLKDLTPKAYILMPVAAGYVISDSNEPKYYRPGETANISMSKGGVITGRVTNSAGDPIVGMPVRAIRVRDLEGRPAADTGVSLSLLFSMSFRMGQWQTDDRGIYRIHTLSQGTYQVAAGGKSMGLGSDSVYDNAPTYHPSSPSYEGATEVRVNAGQEVSNVDIRYRGDRGSAITGTVTGLADSETDGVSISLTRASSRVLEATASGFKSEAGSSFIFEDVPDGDYHVTAMVASERRLNKISQSRRVTVRGADVTGVELALAPLSSISGRAVIKPAQEGKPQDCKSLRTYFLEEIIILARSDKKEDSVNDPQLFLSSFTGNNGAGVPGDKGEFIIGNLHSGSHRLAAQLPGDQWYISAITQPAPSSKGKPLDVARNGVTLKSGEQIKGLTITLSEGAASLKGRVVSSQEGKPLPARLRVHLVPAEKESADDVLRYFEVEAEADGAFELKNIAPGRYWLVPRPVSNEGSSESAVAWDRSGRIGLRFEGEAINTVIELKPCQKVADYSLRYTPPVALTTPTKKKEP